METVLDVRNLNVTYKMGQKRIYAVKDTQFTIEKGDSLGIVGESGSGKSTLAMAVLRLLSPATAEIAGSILFKGRDLLALNKDEIRELRWSELAVVFQKSLNSFSPVHRMGEQIEDIYRVHRPNASKKEVYERVNLLFDMVNLSQRVYRLYPHELSGGMLQRVSIAVSLLHEPSLLILDEATTALDVVTQGQILEEIKKMEQALSMTRMMITHDMSVVASSCNKIAVMYAGEILEIGLVKEVLSAPKHPYTQGLIASFPALRGEKSELKAIAGSLPDLSQTFSDCIFAPRCAQARQACFDKKPVVTQLTGHSWVKCNLYEGV